MIDVAVIGAGLAGLVCAQQLQRAGYRVVVVEKSRGLGGRVATRRLEGGWADHGVRCLEMQGDQTQQLIATLQAQNILQHWTDRIFQYDVALHPADAIHPRYVAPEGITAVAKFLAQGLEIWRNRRVESLTPQGDRTWKLGLESTGASAGSDLVQDQDTVLVAKAVVIAIPAPQALLLLQPLVDKGEVAEPGLAFDPHSELSNLVEVVRSVQFDPCLTVIVGYGTAQQPQATALPWKAIEFKQHSDLAWVGIESSKSKTVPQPIVVIQSTADFAQRHFESADLQAIGRQLVNTAAAELAAWLAEFETLQVHRWRYAFVKQVPAMSTACLAVATPLPLVCSGDWCGGSPAVPFLEAALQSGLAAANQMTALLANTMPGRAAPISFSQLLQHLTSGNMP